MPGAAEQPEAAEQQEVERALRHHKHKRQHGRHDQGAEQGRKHDAHGRVVVEPDPARRDLIERIRRRGQQQQQYRRIMQRGAGPDHEEGAGKADDDGAPTPDADVLVQ